MQEYDEKRPILDKDSHRGMSTFAVDDPRQSLNGVPDDFGDLLLAQEKARYDSTALLNKGIAGLSISFLLVSIAAMIGMPTLIAGLVTHSSDPFAICFLLPTAALLLTLTIVLIMRRAAHGTAHEISLYPFFLKRITLYGLLASLGLVLQAFCGVPSRTPAYVQAGSFIVVIPAACITKAAITRKGYTCRQLVCILLTLTSIVLVMLNLLAHPHFMPGTKVTERKLLVPEALFMNNTGMLGSKDAFPAKLSTLQPGEISTHQASTLAPTTANPLNAPTSITARTLWSLGFSLGWVFYGVAIMLLDDPIRLQKGNPMVVCMYAHMMTFLWIVFMFFFDLIPKFGWVAYLSDFRHNLHHGVRCLFGADSDCAVIAWRGWLEIVIYTAFYITQSYLLAIVDCPIYPVLVTGAAVPAVALTWLCFADTGLDFLWYPTITPLALLVFIAFFIAVPAAVFYHYYRRCEQKEKLDQL